MAIVLHSEGTSARVKRADAYWQMKRAGRVAPTRQEIDPLEIRDLLPYFVIVEIEHAPFRVRYRLCGTEIQSRDEELGGRYLDELTNTDQEDKAAIAEAYRKAVTEQIPAYGITTTRSRQTGFALTAHCGAWPLLGPNGLVEQFMGVVDFRDSERAAVFRR